jgi:glycosyltransferase involved in cell wall biosynthesis
MTTPPYVALIGVLHRFLHPKCRLILWNMDCYPETAERAGVIQPGGVVSRVLRGLNRWIYRRLDSVVCLDEAMRELVAPAYAAEGRPAVHVVPNWEPEALFPRGATPAAWEPGTFFGGRAVVLYLGNAGSGHRFETVLDAAHTIGAEAAVFLFVGGGSAWGPLQEEVERRGLQNVVLRGYVAKADTPSVLACGTAALITLRDSMLGVMSPSKLHASLAMGLPILYVGPPGGNVHEAIQKHGCGVSLRHGDEEGIVDFLERLRRDPRFEADLRARARHAFEADYSDRTALPRFDALIDRGSARLPAAAR